MNALAERLATEFLNYTEREGRNGLVKDQLVELVVGVLAAHEAKAASTECLVGDYFDMALHDVFLTGSSFSRIQVKPDGTVKTERVPASEVRLAADAAMFANFPGFLISNKKARK